MEFFKALNDHTRTTYYVLPLICLNKFSFGPPENFIDAFVTPNGTKVIVKVKSSAAAYRSAYMHEWLLHDGDDHFVFEIPEEFRGDIRLFLQGKYSKFSDKAKDLIRENSSLNYQKERKLKDGKIVKDTDSRILALDKDPMLRARLEYLLNANISDDSELISPPSSSELWVEELVSKS